MKSTAKKWGIGAIGAIVLVAGIILMPLPGPGAVVVLIGMVILSTQFEWAEERLDRVKDWALQGARDSVKSWPRILLSLLGVAWLIGFGIYWCIRPPAPDWWPLRESWWLIGGWGTGATLIFSGVVAGGLLVYSFVKLREDDQQHAENAAAG